MNLPSVLGIISAAFGLLIFLLSVSGAFWPATPVTDPGMLWTSITFVLLGGLCFLLGRRPQAQAP